MRSAAAWSIGRERSTPTTVQPRSARGTRFLAAPQPTSTAEAPPAARSASANARRVRLGGESANPATVPGRVQADPLKVFMRLSIAAMPGTRYDADHCGGQPRPGTLWGVDLWRGVLAQCLVRTTRTGRACLRQPNT